MRARLLRPALGLALASCGILALGATAAPKPVVVEDKAGDANMLNDQGFGLGFDNNATPIQHAPTDIVKATLANTFKGKECTGFTYTMEFSGDVSSSASVIYRLLAATTKNDFIQIYFNNGVAGGGATQIRYRSGDTNERFDLKTPAKIDGKKLVFTITAKEIKAFGEKPGGKIFDLVPEVRFSTGVSFFPVIDQAVAEEGKFFTICG